MRRGSVIFVTIFLLALALPFASSLPRNEQVNIVRGGNSETSCSDEICTTTFYADHRYWQTSERNWAPIDRNFYECSDEEHTRYCTEDYYLSVEADDRGHITLSSEDASLSFWPILEDENRSLDIGTRGNIVRYEDIMDGVEMRYHYGIDSVKEEIIIDEPLETEGDLTFSFGYEGDIEEFAIEQSYICDARGACIYLDQEIDVGTMTISVPSDYLEDESIVYPLVIDPTITLNHSRIGWNGGVEYTPFLFESDAYLRISNPSNFLHSGNVTPDCGAPNCVALPVYMQSEIEWNLNTLPDGATILSANMTLFVNSTDSVPLTLKLAPMDKNHIQYPDTTDVCQGNCEFYNDIENGTAYAQTVVNGNTFFTTLTLNSAARSAMEHAVASGEVFAVGISSNLSKRLVLGSRDNANASRRPSLTLTYTLNNSLLYDANGNLIQGFGKYLEYDSFNHLSVVRASNSTGEILARYFYDHEGKRIKKIEYRGGDVNNNETTYYVSDSFLVVVNATGTFNYTYYYVNDKLLAMKDPNGVKTYYHPDHLGSTTLITNSSGAVVEEEFYLPFGEVYQGSENSRYLYTGKELDRDTDFYYYGARYYQDDFMHFLQPDPLIQNIYEPADLNRYSYVRNNPYKYTDPSGNNPAIAAAGAVAAGVVIGGSLIGGTAGFTSSYAQYVNGEVNLVSVIDSTIAGTIAGGFGTATAIAGAIYGRGSETTTVAIPAAVTVTTNQLALNVFSGDPLSKGFDRTMLGQYGIEYLWSKGYPTFDLGSLGSSSQSQKENVNNINQVSSTNIATESSNKDKKPGPLSSISPTSSGNSPPNNLLRTGSPPRSSRGCGVVMSCQTKPITRRSNGR